MRFAHMADCHIGSWREPKLNNISTDAFYKAVDISIKKGADFILISGDLFNTSLPGIDKLKLVVLKLKELKDLNIPVYIVAGSHDFSASGKTMLDVLESAGLLINVVKGRISNGKLKLNFTVDEKTKAKITGMIGKKGMLEKSFYEDLDRHHLESENGFKIFMFHTTITELKPEELEKIDSSPVSLLPKGFDYYAGGHVHEIIKKELPGYRNIIYPGPLFPNNFREIEKLKCGGFYFYDNGILTYEPVEIFPVYSVEIACSNKTPEEIELELSKRSEKEDFSNAIITIRLSGRIKSGKPSDIRLGDIIRAFYEKNAYFVMKNTAALISEEFEEIKVKEETVDETEKALISENSGQVKVSGMDNEYEKQLVMELMSAFNSEKKEGETKTDFEKRVNEETDRVMQRLLS
jgi:DNA repair exonuclease SbcCD nuclease subunit